MLFLMCWRCAGRHLDCATVTIKTMNVYKKKYFHIFQAWSYMSLKVCMYHLTMDSGCVKCILACVCLVCNLLEELCVHNVSSNMAACMSMCTLYHHVFSMCTNVCVFAAGVSL